MTPLERAARAVRDEIAIPHGDGTFVVEGGFREDRFFLEVARAVIAAIREPSEAVRKAMRQTIPVDGYEWEYNDPIISDGVVIDDEPGDCWRAMIDALLEEG